MTDFFYVLALQCFAAFICQVFLTVLLLKLWCCYRNRRAAKAKKNTGLSAYVYCSPDKVQEDVPPPPLRGSKQPSWGAENHSYFNVLPPNYLTFADLELSSASEADNYYANRVAQQYLNPDAIGDYEAPRNEPTEERREDSPCRGRITGKTPSLSSLSPLSPPLP